MTAKILPEGTTALLAPWGAPALPRLVGVIHLPALPGSPRASMDLASVCRSAAADARALADAGFDGVIVENFGDAPFFPDRVEPVTIAAMTAASLAARAAAPALELGINVLRNDAEAALGVAVCVGATMVRVNVHIGSRVTDQGIVQGLAHRTLRSRAALNASHVKLLCDVDVKHSAPLAPRSIDEEVEEVVGRGLADAVLVTGAGTGKRADPEHLARVCRVSRAPVLVASGATEDTLEAIRQAHGVVVGSALRASGRAGDPIDADAAKRFADAFRRAFV